MHEAIAGFLAQKRIAVVGASREQGFGNVALKELRLHGYDVVPVNSAADAVHGERCFRSLADVQPPVTAALIVVPPEQSKEVVRECARLGVRYVWLQQGAESDEAVAVGESAHLELVHGLCVLMFAQPRSVHRAHRWLHDLFSHGAA